jgi:hypothetical protein
MKEQILFGMAPNAKPKEETGTQKRNWYSKEKLALKKLLMEKCPSASGNACISRCSTFFSSFAGLPA